MFSILGSQMSSIALRVRFDENKALWDFFSHLTLTDIMTFEFITNFSGIQKCSLLYACCSPMFILAHTPAWFGFLKCPSLCSKEAKYTDKASYMRKKVFHPSSSFSVPDNTTESKPLMDRRHYKNKMQKKVFFSVYRSVWFHLHQWRHCNFTSKFKSNCSGEPAMSVIMICLQITILNSLQIQ